MGGSRCAGIRCVIAACLAIALGCALVACSGSGQPAAAKFGDHEIQEQEVTDYTAEYRAEHSLTDDSAWASYLVSNGMSVEEWRERVIRSLADRLLIQDKASELGISANEEDVEKKISQAKQQYGIAEDDEDAWRQKLSELGTSEEEYRSELEFSSIEQQVLTKEISTESLADKRAQREYVNKNLADRIVHRYSSISFPASSKGRAEKRLAELKRLSGKKLAARFAELAREISTDSSSKDKGGDIGWDIAQDMTQVDSNSTLGLIGTGELWPKAVKSSDGYRLLLCTKRFVFKKNMTADDMPDEDLKTYLVNMVTMANWSSASSDYLTRLEDDAQIQAAQMPQGLPYDVDLSNASTDGGAVSESSSSQTSP